MGTSFDAETTSARTALDGDDEGVMIAHQWGTVCLQWQHIVARHRQVIQVTVGVDDDFVPIVLHKTFDLLCHPPPTTYNSQLFAKSARGDNLHRTEEKSILTK